jgi:hypothetical protein
MQSTYTCTLIHGRNPLGGRPAMRRPALFGLAALGNSKVELGGRAASHMEVPQGRARYIVR